MVSPQFLPEVPGGERKNINKEGIWDLAEKYNIVCYRSVVSAHEAAQRGKLQCRLIKCPVAVSLAPTAPLDRCWRENVHCEPLTQDATIHHISLTLQ